MNVGTHLTRINNDTGSIDDVLSVLHACNDLKLPEMSFNLRRACCDFIMRKYIAYARTNAVSSKDVQSVYNQCSFLLKNAKMMNKYGISDTKRDLFARIIGQ